MLVLHDWNSAARDIMTEFIGTLNSSNKAMTNKVNELQSTLIDVTENLRQVQNWKTSLNTTLLNQYMIMTYLKSNTMFTWLSELRFGSICSPNT